MVTWICEKKPSFELKSELEKLGFQFKIGFHLR